MTALLVFALVAVVVFYLATSGVLIGPAEPRSGPEAWVVDDRAPKGPRTRS